MKERRKKLIKKLHFGAAGMVGLSGLSLLLPSCQQKEDDKPNIIFLLTDDHRWDALGYMGNPIIKTPHLDGLARGGVIFQNAYVTTSISACSRACLLTGQYTSRHGITSFSESFSSEEMQNTYPLLLKNQANYKIGFIGKYGVGLDFPDKYFDYWACEKKGQPDYENYDEKGNFIHHTDLVNNQIDEFLEQFGTSDQPFCLSVSFKAPHIQDGDIRQFIPQERFNNLYSDVEIPLPVTYDSCFYYKFPEDFRFPVPGNKTIINENRRRWNLEFTNYEQYQGMAKNYYRLISGVDECVGNILAKLKELDLEKRTIIIFMGDNGFYLGEHGFSGKWYGHQESVRVPLFIYDPRLPKKKQGISLSQIALNIDIAPTILSMAGVSCPETMQGVDLNQLVSDKSNSWRTEFFYEMIIEGFPSIPKSIGIVSKDYTYLRYPELVSGFEEFYDLKNDPLQVNNLIGTSSSNELIEEYRSKTKELEQSVK
jgi:arylsulfatase A-like enzyme